MLRHPLSTPLFLVCALGAAHAQEAPPPAQPSADQDAAAEDATAEDGEVTTLTVTATQLSLDPDAQPYAFYRHDRQELDDATGRTALDRIDYGPGVIMQHTAPGQTSPYIRGLTGKQSLLLFDGVRLSHATMRGGPNQYSALVPDMSIDSIDVILGSSGVVTGSDGLTGALDLRLAPAGRRVGRAASPWLGLRIDGANGSQTMGGVDGEPGAWRYSLEASYDDFHDRIGGQDAADNVFGPGKPAYGGIPNTAYEQWAVAGRVAYDGFADQTLELAGGRTSQQDARRPDGYFENSGVDNRISRYYDPESFTYVHLRHRWAPRGAVLEDLTVTGWWHQQDEHQKREDLTGGGEVYRRREYDDRIDSIGVEPRARFRFGSHQLTLGVLALFERTTNGYGEQRNPDGIDPAGAMPHDPDSWASKTTITDGAAYDTYAVYLQELWDITDSLSLLAGVRYTRVAWDFDVASNEADDFTGSLRANWRFLDDMMLFVGASKAFRAPNLNDLDGATDRASSGMTSFGNPDLDPESSYTGELGWRFGRGRDQLAVSAFYTVLDDLIQTVYPAGGGDGVRENGEGAWLRGVEVQWDYGVAIGSDRLALVGSLTWLDTEAEVSQPDGTLLTQPISRANRLYGIAGLRYDFARNWWARAQVRFHDAYDEDDVTEGDAGDVRLTVPGDEDGTAPGFAIVDLAGGWRNDRGDRWVTLTFENVADETYRKLGSGADAEGRNVAIAAGLRY